MIGIHTYRVSPHQSHAESNFEGLNALARVCMLTTAVFLAYHFPLVIIAGFLALSTKTIYNSIPLRNSTYLLDSNSRISFSSYSYQNRSLYCSYQPRRPRYSPMFCSRARRVPVGSRFYTPL